MSKQLIRLTEHDLHILVEDTVKQYLTEFGPSWAGIKNSLGGIGKGNWYLGQTYKTGKFASQFNKYAKQAQDSLAQLKNIANQTSNKEIADEITNTSRMLGKASTGFAKMAKNTQKPGNAMNTSVQNPWGADRQNMQKKYNQLNKNYKQMSGDYNTLQQNNSQLQQAYGDMSSAYNDLYDRNSQLQQKYNSLNQPFDPWKDSNNGTPTPPPENKQGGQNGYAPPEGYMNQFYPTNQQTPGYSTNYGSKVPTYSQYGNEEIPNVSQPQSTTPGMTPQVNSTTGKPRVNKGKAGTPRTNKGNTGGRKLTKKEREALEKKEAELYKQRQNLARKKRVGSLNLGQAATRQGATANKQPDNTQNNGYVGELFPGQGG
jgi:hypothetical protein